MATFDQFPEDSEKPLNPAVSVQRCELTGVWELLGAELNRINYFVGLLIIL